VRAEAADAERGAAGTALLEKGRGAEKPSARRSVMPLILRLHFYAGVLVAPFLVIAAVTGLAFVFTPQLDALVYGEKLHVDGRGEQRPVGEQVEAAIAAAHPDGSVSSVLLSGEADRTT